MLYYILLHQVFGKKHEPICAISDGVHIFLYNLIPTTNIVKNYATHVLVTVHNLEGHATLERIFELL
jgi:hypothetical protein